MLQNNPASTSTKAIAKRSSAARRWGPVIVALAAIGLAGWYFFGVRAADSQKSNYLAEAVTRGDIENSITAVGTLSALRSINVGAQVSGQLNSVKVLIGDKVTEGQLIAQIDPAPFEKKVQIASAQLDNLKAQLLSKQAQLTLKKLNSTRQRTLLATQGVAQSVVEQADADLTIADADVKALQAQIRQQEAQLASGNVDLGYTKIYSPMNGTVVDQTAKEGETLNAVQSAPTIVTVADLNVMTVEAQVSEADIGKLKPGMPVYFTLLGQANKRYSATLRQIKPTPETTNNVVLYFAMFDVPNPNGELMISMSTQVYFVLGEAQNVLLVPISALQFKREKPGKPTVTVKVVDASGAIVEKPVEIGVRNRVQAEVLSGLAEGDRVVVTAASQGQPAGTGNRGGNRRPGGMPFF